MFNDSNSSFVNSTAGIDHTAANIQGWISIVILVPGLFLSGTVLVTLALDSSGNFNKAVRLILSSILGGCMLTGSAGLMSRLMSLICGYTLGLPPSENVCKAFNAMFLSGAALRFAFMATMAVSVFLLVWYRNLSNIWKMTVAISITLWVAIPLLCLAAISSDVYGIYFVHGVVCLPYLQSNTGAYFYFTITLLIIPFASYIIVIVVPVVGLHWIKQQSVTGDLAPQKALIKFTFFLLIGNTFSLLSLIILLIHKKDFEIIKGDQDKELNVLYAQTILAYVSPLPTPIMIIAYFKSIRYQIYYFFLKKITKRK